MTGYRVALVAELPREKVYPELRKAIAAGSVTKTKLGYSLVDPEIRQLLRSRVRVVWGSYSYGPEGTASDTVDPEFGPLGS